MANLVDYLRAAKEKGYSEQDIYKLFLDKGYTKKEIEYSLSLINGKKENKSYNVPKEEISFFRKIGLLFSHPKLFFETVKDDGIGKSIGLFLLTALTISILNYGLQRIIYAFMSGEIYGSYGITNMFTGIAGLFSIIILIISFAFTFVFAAISHGILKIAKCEGRYIDSLNIYLYSGTLGILCSIIPFVGLLGIIYSIVLMVIGFKEYYNTTIGKAITAVIIPLVGIFVLFGIIIFYLLFSIRLF